MTMVQAAPPTPVEVRRSIPGRIRVITGVSVLALALLFSALAVGSSSAREGLRVIGRDSGPQVVATAGLYLGLSDMDTQVADALVMGRGYAQERKDALARYEQRRAEAHQALLKAFELSGNNPAGRRTVQSVLDSLGRYEQLAARALLLDEQSGHLAGAPPTNVVQTYRQATDLMKMVILPQAYNLTLESGTIVRATYDEKSAQIPLLRFAIVVAGLLALGCLGWLQLYLSRRFRRVFGPALLVATAVTLASLVAGVSVLGKEENDLRTAKVTGFDSVLSLAKARAISNSLHGDQSRYLLDKGRADTYEHTFLDKSQTVVYLATTNLDAYQTKVASGAKDYQGLLGTQLAGPYGKPVIDSFTQFQAADREARRLALSGQPIQAVSQRLGDVDTAYDNYDKALLTLSDQHQKVFLEASASGENALDTLWRLLPFAIAAIGLLVVAGVWPRLKEYR